MTRKFLFLLVLFVGIFLSSSIIFAQTADTTPPSAPTGVTATLNQYRQVSISWTAATDNVGVVGYNIYRNGIFLAATGATSFIDAAPYGVYTYAVSAYDAAGNVSPQSLPSAVVNVVQDTTPPSAPTWISLTATTSSVVLSWNAASDNVGVVGYYIYKNGVQIPFTTPLTATTYTDSGLLPGMVLTYKVGAYDASGNSTFSDARTISTLSDITPPSTPVMAAAVATSSSEIDITWQPATDNVAVAGYYVYRNGSQIGNVSSSTTSYADTGLTSSAVYSYTVAAYDAAGNVSPQSLPVQALTLPRDTTPPTAPLYFYAKVVSDSEIDLSWQAAVDNVGVAGYYLDRDGTQIANIASTTYADTGLASSTFYGYTVQAYDAAGNVSSLTSAAATTFAAAPVAPAAIIATTTISSSTLTVTANPIAPAANNYPTIDSIKAGLNNVVALITPLEQQTAALGASPSAAAVSNIQSQISALIGSISDLESALAGLQGKAVASSQIPSNFSYTWQRDLYFGLTNDPDVLALQKALTLEGVYSGPLTGNFFSLTAAAVQAFQRKHNFTGVSPHGEVGPYTRQVLNGLYSKQ